MATAEREQRTTFIRQDGKDKVTGLGRYTADLTFTGMLHAKFRYSDHAHARILRVDTAAARALPGVFAVITADDVPDVRYGPYVQDRSLFARDVVRFEGEVVAAVAALTAEIAERAAALIEVDYEPLPVVIDPEEALADGAPLVHDGWAGLRRARGHGPGRQRRFSLDDRQGRRGARAGRVRRRPARALRGRHVACGADRAAGGDCPVER